MEKSSNLNAYDQNEKHLKPKVAAIAIAKDEGPYLHEWIHHCFYFGFTDVFIGINRTSDNSIELLERIQRHYPNVHFESLDWMDKVDIPLHVPALTYLFHKVASQYADISHVMVIDIDEFWMPLDFKAPIDKFISDFGNPDAITFPWLNESSALKEFARPFEHFAYQIALEGKTVSKTSLWDKIEHVRSHSPYILDLSNVDWCGARGQRLNVLKHEDKKAEMAKAALSQPLAFIYHRQIRSEMEYLASIVRGRAKFNRSGVAGELLVGLPVRIRGSKVIYRQNNEKDPYIEIEPEELEGYYQSLNAFITKCEIFEDIETSRSKKRSFADEFTFEKYGKEIIKYLQVYCLSFYGTRQYPILLKNVKSLVQENVNHYPKVAKTILALKKDGEPGYWQIIVDDLEGILGATSRLTLTIKKIKSNFSTYKHRFLKRSTKQ